MWRWLSVISILVSLNAAAEVPASSVGPTSREEGDLIWREGHDAFDLEKYRDAANSLQRLVDRYPGHTGYLEAHRMLGKSYLELKEFENAVPPLKYYISGTKLNTKSAQARLWLEQAFMSQMMFKEAYFTSLEIEKTKVQIPLDIRAENLLLKSKALIGMNHDDRATLSLISAKKIITSSSVPLKDLDAQAAAVELHIKIRSCSLFPSTGPLDEGQIRDQISRRGTCLIEALLPLRSALEAADSPSSSGSKWALDAEQKINEAFQNYSQICSNPTAPKGKRTKIQLSRYKAELAEALEHDCREKFVKALDFLSTWKTQVPAISKNSSGAIAELEKNLKTLSHAGSAQ